MCELDDRQRQTRAAEGAEGADGGGTTTRRDMDEAVTRWDENEEETEGEERRYLYSENLTS